MDGVMSKCIEEAQTLRVGRREGELASAQLVGGGMSALHGVHGKAWDRIDEFLGNAWIA
jgi:hypothetical protein